MQLGNNHLQEAKRIADASLEWDGDHGRLQYLCATCEEYEALRRLLTHEFGSALLTDDGKRWWVRSTADDADPDGEFPQVITAELVQVEPRPAKF